MYILHKHIAKEIVKNFTIILAIVTGIYLIVDFFERIDNFMEAGAPMGSAIWFFLLKLPFIISQVLPVAVLLAVLVSMGLMSKNNEIIALKSSGIGVYNLFKPIALIGIAISLFLFFLSEVVVPITMSKSNRIYLTKVKKVATYATRQKNIWIKGKRSITHIKHYNAAARTIFDITLHQFDRKFKLIRRVDAARGEFKNGKWVLVDIMEQLWNETENRYDIKFFERKAEPVDLLPEDLKRVAKESEEMSFNELRDYIDAIEAEGYNASNYRVDLHAKTAFPFVCLIMSMIGTGISVRGKAKEGLAMVVSYGLGLVFLYWVSFSFCISLGYGGLLPPLMAAWLTNMFFLCIGGILLLNAD